MNLDKALQILGLTRNFTEQELKKAYRTLITKYHPDKFETKSEREKKEAEERSKEINVAKEFEPIKIRMVDFVNDAKERLKVYD